MSSGKAKLSSDDIFCKVVMGAPVFRDSVWLWNVKNPNLTWRKISKVQLAGSVGSSERPQKVIKLMSKSISWFYKTFFLKHATSSTYLAIFQ